MINITLWSSLNLIQLIILCLLSLNPMARLLTEDQELLGSCSQSSDMLEISANEPEQGIKTFVHI